MVQPRIFHAHVNSALRRKALVDKLDDSESILFSLAASVEERNGALAKHCERLARIASSIGLALQLPPDDILALQRGGYLHDIGKVAIPDQVLFKPGPLTPDEWRIMEGHTVKGEQICQGMKSLRNVLPIIRHHHEKWDGSGYPDRLRGDEIPLLARIVQLADIYDALTAERSYKRGAEPDRSHRSDPGGDQTGLARSLFDRAVCRYASLARRAGRRHRCPGCQPAFFACSCEPGKPRPPLQLFNCQRTRSEPFNVRAR